MNVQHIQHFALAKIVRFDCHVSELIPWALSEAAETFRDERGFAVLLKVKKQGREMAFSIRLNKYLLKEHLCHPVAATRRHSEPHCLKFNIRIVHSNDPLESILLSSYVSSIFFTKVLFVCSVFSFPVIPPAHHSLSHTLDEVKNYTQKPRKAGGCGSKSMAPRLPGLGTKLIHHICNKMPTKKSVENMNAWLSSVAFLWF
jgi:hypothetical protein